MTINTADHDLSALRQPKLPTGRSTQTRSVRRHSSKIEPFMEKLEFQTEVNQLLQLIIHSLYSHREIFLRELISNASDALDKLKYLNLTTEPYKSLTFDPRIDLELDEANGTLTISDTGIGMNR